MDQLASSKNSIQPISPLDAAKANDIFEHFVTAGTLKTIFGSYRNLCDLLHLKPNVFPSFYPKLKSNLNSWKAKALWKKFDARASHKCYSRGKACPSTRVLIIGAGPCGLRTAIEAQLLGAKVVVVEKRDRMSRNNVLHLWPFVIEDLRALGAKKFFGKFCAGAIDHISIRQLQCILLKVALLLGVEVHTEVSFEKLVEPSNVYKNGWRAEFKPLDHPVSQYEFDVIIGADGKRNTLQGFKRKEFRGKLAIAITANFINKRTEAEARVEEISGVAFIFNQKFFKELNVETGIDLENIVYYKDDTHYFVMTAKKLSLIDKGVIKQDYADTAKLLSPENVDKEALLDYARQAADFSTNYQMPDLEFAVNHYGQPDVAMFDFTSMYAAENASKVIERSGYKLLMILVGDSLLEPFWPTGSGCARGFLSSLDACWAIKAWGSGLFTPLEVLAERESIYRLLAQTTPENLNKDCKSYTVDPSTRYPNLNRAVLLPQQVLGLYDSDNPSGIELTTRISKPQSTTEIHRKRRRRDLHLDPNILISWIKDQIKEHEDLTVEDITTSFKDGRVLCAILHHYRPDLIDYSQLKSEDIVKNNQLAFDLLEKELGIAPIMTGEEMANTEVPDYVTMFSYLTQIYDTFRGEIPHIKHPKLETPESKESIGEKPKFTHCPLSLRSYESASAMLSNRSAGRSKLLTETALSTKTTTATDRRTKKRKSFEKSDKSVEERLKRLEEIAVNRVDRQNRRRQQRKMQIDQFLKSMQMLQMNCKPGESTPFEDYSLFVYRQTAPQFQDRVKNLEKKFTYVPDRENQFSPVRSGGTQEELAARIKNLEDKWQDQIPLEKRPRDLNRAIGKIETSDWNIKEIAKKIKENKLGKPVSKEKERVPKWNRDQFVARQTKMEKQHYDRQNSAEAKYLELDNSIKKLEQKLKEGSTRDLGTNKVAAITEKLVPKSIDSDEKPVLKPNFKPPVSLLSQTNFEDCHFCKKRVYLMERLCAEGRFFHRGCFRCQYCHTSLRLGSYMFDRDGQYGNRFYCTQHYGMPGEIFTTKVDGKVISDTVKKEYVKPLEKLKIPAVGVETVDLLDRVQTPERVEFANLSTGNISSDHDESVSQMDEDEWTDRNFGASTAEVHTSDDDEDSSSLSGSESDNEDVFEEAIEEPPTKEGTMKWMERYKQRYSKSRKHNDDSYSDDYTSSSDHYYENTSGDEDDDPVTESEEEIRARELRKQEVNVQPPMVQTDTGSDTEIVSDESSSESSSSKQNSATEISTDSEFAVDDPTPTREIPSIILNDFYVTKSRGQYSAPKKVQVKSGILQSPINGKTPKCGIELEFTPLVPSPVLPKPAHTLLPVRNEGYALNRTQSTGGIATKVSLELKKKYLLGDDGGSRNIQKSGSVATLDSVFKSFHSNISDCQKLLKPSSELSPCKQSSPSKLSNDIRSPLSPIISQDSPLILPEGSDFNNIEENLVADSVKALAFDAKALEVIDLTSPTGRDTNRPSNIDQVVQNKLPSSVQEEKVSASPPKIAADFIIQEKDSDMSSDSLTLDTDSDQHYTGLQKIETKKPFTIIPRVEVHNDEGEILSHSGDDLPLDSLGTIPNCVANSEVNNVSVETAKSIASEKKCLNQPKTLPGLQMDLFSINSHNTEVLENIDTRESTPSEHDSYIEHTEMSDWARDSDDFEDVEFELNPDLIPVHKSKHTKKLKQVKQGAATNKAHSENFNQMVHICGKEKQIKDGINKFSDIMGSIEFMDTGEETSSDEEFLHETAIKNNGYVEFLNEDDIAADSLNPCINVIETVNPQIQQTVTLENLSTHEKNTGYCVIETYDNIVGIHNKLKQEDTPNLSEDTYYNNEDDSLLCVEGVQPTTEENTCSDSTVRNLVKPASLKNEGSNDVLINKDQDNYKQNNRHLEPASELNDVQHLSDKYKLKQKDKADDLTTPDLIKEEMLNIISASPPKTPKNIYTKEEIKKVRDENQRLVQEIVMNKMKAQNKSLERKKHIRNSYSPNRSFDLCKSFTMDMGEMCNNKDVSVYATPDVLLTSNCSISRTTSIKSSDVNSVNLISTSKQHSLTPSKQLNVHSSYHNKPNALNKSLIVTNPEVLSLPDIQQALNGDDLGSSHLIDQQNLQKSFDKQYPAKDVGCKNVKSLEKFEETMCSLGADKENVNIHIQDSIESLVLNTERRNSLLYCNDTLTKKRVKNGNHSTLEFTKKLSVLQPVRTKSVTEISKPYIDCKLNDTDINVAEQLCKSDPNLLTKDYTKCEKKAKGKDRERRKSISKLISDFFGKKKDVAKNGSSSKGFLSRISPKSKSKSMINLSGKNAEVTTDKRTLARSFSGSALSPNWRIDNNISPPPIPPLPLNYLNTEPVCDSDDSSDGGPDYRSHHGSENIFDAGRRSSRTARKAARQAQLKRHRIAQEIQRKLEETEVKTRDLEYRGVLVEKELRGEINSSNGSKEETELLKEWFDLMHDLTELRRYERELIVRAQELELEDRHARLQQELRERLDNEDHKTKEDAKTERSIINEMMEIVAKRDCLISILEQDRIRYSEEDRDFEEQMVAKGLTPLEKTPNK